MKRIAFIAIAGLLLSSPGTRAQDIHGLLPGLRYTPEQVGAALKVEPSSVEVSPSGDGTDLWAYRDVVLQFDGDALVGWKLTGPRYKAFKRYGGLKVGQGVNALNRVRDAFPKRIPGTYIWTLFDHQKVYYISVESVDTKIRSISCYCWEKPAADADPDYYRNALEIPEEKLY